MIWNVKCTTLSSGRSSSCCLDSSFEISSKSSSFFWRRSSSDGAETLRCDGPAGLSRTMAGTPPEFVTGSWRRIVLPAFAPNSEGSGGTTLGRGAGAVTSFTRNATLPKVMTSFSPAIASVIRAPFRKVPLEEPTSFTFTPPSVRLTSAWRREIVGS